MKRLREFGHRFRTAKDRPGTEWANLKIVPPANGAIGASPSGSFLPPGFWEKPPMITNDPSNLEPIELATARDLYLDHKASQCRDATVQSHRYRTRQFVEWCKENDIDNMNDLSGRDIYEYRLWRKSDGDLNQISLQTQMSTLHVFLKWYGTIEAVDQDLYNKILVLQVSQEEEQSDVMLDADRAQKIMQYLRKFHYASLEHVPFAILWETGMQIGAAQSLDVDDLNSEDQYLQLVYRPKTGTTLKNGLGWRAASCHFCGSR